MSKPSPAYLRAYRSLYGRDPDSQSAYKPERLSDPEGYYRTHMDKLHVRGDWADCRCPLHDDKNPSLSVNLKHGGFKCRGCDASGSSIVDFHMRLNSMSFVDAARALGAWEDSQ